MRGLLKIFFVILTMSFLGACATQSPSPDTSAASRATKLMDLGFVKTEDGYILNLPGAFLFDTASDQLLNDAKTKIKELSANLLQLDIHAVRLFGHTDNVGSAEFNNTLSAKRAESVARVFAENGFKDANIERRGFGYERPIASNETPEGRSQNRRVVIIVPF